MSPQPPVPNKPRIPVGVAAFVGLLLWIGALVLLFTPASDNPATRSSGFGLEGCVIPIIGILILVFVIWVHAASIQR